MPSKKSTFEALRKGEAIEWEPGVYARLNPETRKLETSTGKRLEVPEDIRAELFPSKESLPLVESREKVQSSIAESPLGEFGHQFFNQGVPGAVKDWYNYITKSGEDYIRNKSAENYESGQISEQSPWISAGATGANIGLDLLLTRGMSGATAVPTLMAAQAGPRVLEEPLQVAGEAALGAGAGKILDMGANYIGKTAGRRGLSREVSEQGALIREINEVDRLSTQSLKEQTSNQRIQSMNQYKQDLAKWKGDIASSEAKYSSDLKAFEKTQQAAKKQYSDEVVRQAEKIASKFPKNTRVTGADFEPGVWIENEIERTGLMNTPSGKLASNIVKSIFPEQSSMTPMQLSKAYRSLENHILNSEPQVSNLLLGFKEHLAQKLPVVLGDSLAISRVLPALEKDVLSAASKALNNVKFETGMASRQEVEKKIKDSLQNYFGLMNSKGFSEKISSGSLFDQIVKDLFLPADFSQAGRLSAADLKALKKQRWTPDQLLTNSKRAYQDFTGAFNRDIQNVRSKYGIKGGIAQTDAQRYLGLSPQKTTGISPDMPAPPVPIQPAAPMYPAPMAPVPAHVPIPEPILPPATSVYERLGDVLEKPLLKGNMTDSLMKLGLLKMIGGPTTHALEGGLAAGYGVLKGLTNPNIPGAAITQGGGLAAIDAMAKKYYSYHNGILDDPAERRSLAREIEDDENLSLEDKAILQSKVNRGKSIFSPIV